MGKHVERSYRGLFEENYTGICLEGLKKVTKQLRVAGLHAKI